MNTQRFSKWLIVFSLLLLALLISNRLTLPQVVAKSADEPCLNNSSRRTLAPPTLQQAVRRRNDDPSILQPAYGVEISRGYHQSVIPGDVVTYTHVLTNTGDAPDVFVLDATSFHGWSVALLGGTYPTGTAHLPLSLDAGLTTTFQVSVSVPARLISGTASIINSAVDTIVITATSQTSPTVYATTVDTVTVLARVFLPRLGRILPPRVQLSVDFGLIVTETDILTYDLPLVKEMGASWVRIYLPWPSIEQSPGQYNWEPYDAVFERLSEVGLEPLPIVLGTPEWAGENTCGPISDTMAFEGFLEAVLQRYGHYADAWEFINEPDGGYLDPTRKMIAGCWGPYPEEYASQLGIFYTKVKSLDPDALVIFGGLAYDRWEYFERTFFPETLRAGAGQFFDIANVHYYPINPIEFPTMAHKVNEIRDIMAMHSIYGKRIWMTETGMWVNGSGSLEHQRDFIVRELTRGFGAGVDNMFWFSVKEHPVDEGRAQRWLIDINHQPINGYYTFQHYADKLEGTYCAGLYQNVPAGVEAYKFVAPERSLYILWSNTVTQTVTIPASADATLTSRDGDASYIVPVQDGWVSFEVATEPVFLEIAPTGTSVLPMSP